MYSIVVKHLYNLQSDPFGKSNTHLAQYKVITILLTIFQMLYFISLWKNNEIENIFSDITLCGNFKIRYIYID